MFDPLPEPPVYLNGSSHIHLLFRDDSSGSSFTDVDISSLLPPLDLVHQFTRLPERANPVEGFDGILVGSFQGLSALYIGHNSTAWEPRVKYVHLAYGAPLHKYSPYKGVQGADICFLPGSGKKSSSMFGYIPTTGPWEGVDILTPTTVQVHRPTLNPSSAEGLVVDGHLESSFVTQRGAQAHVVVCGDFRKQGIDDFIVGQRGPVKDIVYFTAQDGEASSFHWSPLVFDDNIGASGLAVGDFDGDGWLDFASTGFPGFGDPAMGDHYVAIFWNRLGSQKEAS